MIRTRANILMKVKVTCVRDAMVTLQQFTATTNATETREGRTAGQREVYVLHCMDAWSRMLILQTEGGVRPLTHSTNADEFDKHGGSNARREERLHHIAAERQGHIGSNSRPVNTENRKLLLRC